MEEKEKKTGRIRVSSSFKVGAIALAFMILGYQVALFVREAAVSEIVANRDHPDTVFVSLYPTDSFAKAPDYGSYIEETGHVRAQNAYDSRKASDGAAHSMRKNSSHSPEAYNIYRANVPRRYESFAFNPNEATVDELMRLGFTEKQANSIDSYRNKGGRFRRKADFAKSYVVSDSLFNRLEPFIVIPKLDINLADSASFDALPGIGPYFASKMVTYRDRLQGYSYPEQLLEIWKMDSARYSGFSDLIEVGPARPYPLWTLPEDSLARHPYIGRGAAHGIVLFRSAVPLSQWSVSALRDAGILSDENARRLSGCRIADP